MSERYEWIEVEYAEAELVELGTELGANIVENDCALVLGNPDATAFVIQGSRDEMRRFVLDLAVLVGKFAETPE